MARTKNATQVKPTSDEIKDTWRRLKVKSEKGDTLAILGLLALDMLDKNKGEFMQECLPLKMAAPLAAYIPRTYWHHFPVEVQELACTLMDKVGELE